MRKSDFQNCTWWNFERSCKLNKLADQPDLTVSTVGDSNLFIYSSKSQYPPEMDSTERKAR